MFNFEEPAKLFSKAVAPFDTPATRDLAAMPEKRGRLTVSDPVSDG